MTYAPDDLMAVRRYLLSVTGLSGAAVGIVGDDDHPDGYHVGNDALIAVGKLASDYSKRESSRDRPGSNAASALDVGSWSGRRGAAKVTFLEFSAALVAACRAGDARAADIREIIYTPDGSTVKRHDRLGIRSTGDNSHLYHTHLSFFRTSEGRRDRRDNLLGLLRTIFEGDIVADIGPNDTHAWREAQRIASMVGDTPTVADSGTPAEENKMHTRLVRMESKLDALSVGGITQEALTAALVAALTSAAVDAALRAIVRAEVEAAEDS